MPYKNRAYRRHKTRLSIEALREKRHSAGQCVQCGAPVEINPKRDTYYWLCGKDQNNCRGANASSKAAWCQREKEKEAKLNG